MYFKYKGSTKDVNCNQYYNSKELLYGIKNQNIKLSWCSQKTKRVVKGNKWGKIGHKSFKQKE